MARRPLGWPVLFILGSTPSCMPLWIPLAFVAVILWVIGNMADKFLVEKYFKDSDEHTDADTLLMFSAAFAIPALLLALFMGAKIDGLSLAAVIGLCAGVANGAYLFSYLKAVGRTELSRIIPIAQTVPLFGFIFAWMFLGEHIPASALLAGGVILLGAVVLVYHRGAGRVDLHSLFLILCASAAIALQMVLFKMSAETLGYWTGIFWTSVGLCGFGVVLYVRNTRSRQNFNALFRERSYGIISVNVVVECIELLAILVFSYAVLLGPVALVQTVTAYQPIVLLIATYAATRFGFSFLKEDISHSALVQKIAGIILIGVGSYYAYAPFF